MENLDNEIYTLYCQELSDLITGHQFNKYRIDAIISLIAESFSNKLKDEIIEKREVCRIITCDYNMYERF